MEDVGTGAGHRAPPEVLRRLALAQRVSARAASHARVADAVLRRRAPKLLAASTRIAPPTELHPLDEAGGAARPPAPPAPAPRAPPGPAAPAPQGGVGRGAPHAGRGRTPGRRAGASRAGQRGGRELPQP